MDFRQYSSLAEALAGTQAPADVLEGLALVDVPYRSFTGASCTGQLVVDCTIVEEVKEIFEELYREGFPLARIVPIAFYGWDDEASMAANNTSAFNYRTILGTNRLSNHSRGRAIDINPLLNPYSAYDGKIYPPGARYDPTIPGTLASGSNAVEAFARRGWTWLGERSKSPDYQHFEK